MSQARALVVDDHPLNVDLAAFVLAAKHFEVATATDADSARVQLLRFRPDVVLMDIQLPGVDGLALTREWKSDPATRHVIIIAFTAYAMKGDEARLLAAGCDGYLAKPIDVTRFADQVLAVLQTARGVPRV
jgi:CheY-like chemotaxis protein